MSLPAPGYALHAPIVLLKYLIHEIIGLVGLIGWLIGAEFDAEGPPSPQ